jgi:hypothetical protein
MRESGSREKSAAVPFSPMSLLSAAAVFGRAEGRRKSGSLKKRAVILGEPIWRCWATDLSRKERGKVVPSKRVAGSRCEFDFSGCLYATGSTRTGMRKSGSRENSVATRWA